MGKFFALARNWVVWGETMMRDGCDYWHWCKRLAWRMRKRQPEKPKYAFQAAFVLVTLPQACYYPAAFTRRPSTSNTFSAAANSSALKSCAHSAACASQRWRTWANTAAPRSVSE